MSASRGERRIGFGATLALAAGLAALAALAVVPAPAGAQPAPAAPESPGVLAALGLDRLQLTGVGASYGVVKPAQIVSANAFGVHADYGSFARQWRAVFGATYWDSRYGRDVVRRLEDSLRAAIVDPTGDADLSLGEIDVTVIALTADARWSPLRRPRWLRPYVGGSVGGYATNAEGRAISGTFLEDALDNIAAGVAGVAGAEIFPAPNVSLGMHVRYDILGGTRFATLRTGFTYIFRSREGA